ncbi:MAG: RloB domain-containing protein [Leptospiraceae bacterium]|nr:RloB domain-containing protein [Leptospiraceae bacterium]
MSYIKKRKTGKKEVREPILIVCEDSKSSVFYLRDRIRVERLTTTQVEVSGESNSAPISVVDYAIQRKKEQRRKAKREGIYEFKEIYCVMDVDNHETLSNAKRKALDNNLIPIVSNECFELWYLIHFIEQNAYIERNDIYKKLNKIIEKEYNKSDKKISEDLNEKGSEKEAINRAKKLERQSEDSNPELFIKKNPSTDVYILVEKIIELSKNQ